MNYFGGVYITHGTDQKSILNLLGNSGRNKQLTRWRRTKKDNIRKEIEKRNRLTRMRLFSCDSSRNGAEEIK